MYENPQTLQELCLETICDNIFKYIEPLNPDDCPEFHKYEQLNNNDENKENFNDNDSDNSLLDDYNGRKYRFRDPDIYLINEISEKLLKKLNDKNLLYDSTLLLFNQKNTILRNVSIKNSKITVYGLQILKQHKLIDLECVNLKNLSISDILDCLNEWTITNLLNVNFTKCTFIDLSRHSLMVKMTQLKNLRSLNLSYTELNQISFQMICEDLKFLEKLDISGTFVKDLQPLLNLTDQLISLSVVDLHLAKNYASTIIKLKNLRYLDVSLLNEKLDLLQQPIQQQQQQQQQTTNQNYEIIKLFENINELKQLHSIDISGWKDIIPYELIDNFIKTHKKLEYLGIVFNDIIIQPKYSNQSLNNYPKHLIIGGLGNEEQIKITLKYYKDRSIYIQKALYYLFQLTNNYQESRNDLIKLILPCMLLHQRKFGVQMAATACLYNLTRGDLSKRIHPKLLSQSIELTLKSMELYPEEFQLQKNSLLILCSDTILQEINFNRYHCAKLVLDALCTFDDVNMNRMAVAICSILAAKISTIETSKLGSKTLYMNKLLSMVKNRVETRISDITLKFTLSALWNLTDESSPTCQVFLELHGAELFLHVLEVFENDQAIETKVLGLLNNIAEVSYLRYHLMLDKLIKQLFNLLDSNNIDVSYFAAGIVAHLTSDGDTKWLINSFKRYQLLEKLELIINQWRIPDSEMVAYRSFRPFFPLLNVEMDYQVQLWAVWAIHHVCTKNPKRYCVMLCDENGHLLLNDLINYKNSHVNIKRISMEILQTVEKYV